MQDGYGENWFDRLPKAVKVAFIGCFILYFGGGLLAPLFW